MDPGILRGGDEGTLAKFSRKLHVNEEHLSHPPLLSATGNTQLLRLSW